MSNISLGGLISGVDTDGIIRKLMDIQNQRITSEQTKKAALQAKQDAWTGVKSALSDLRSKMDALRLVGTFRARSVTLADSTVATATASAGATLTTHNLSVSQLAQTQSAAGGMFASPTAQLNITGSLTINGKVISLDPQGQDTLYSLRDKINGTADVGVTADVVKVMQGTTAYYRMVLTSKTQGTAGAIRIGGSSDPAQVSGFAAGGSHQVQAVQLAIADQARSDSFTDATQLFSGTFTLTANGAAHDLDFRSGATLSQIRDVINAAVPGLAAVAADANGSYLQLDDTTALGGAGFTLTKDSGLLQQLGLNTDANLVVKQQAAYTIDGGATQYANANAVVSSGLTLSLNATGTQPATVSDAPVALGFLTSSGAYANEISRAQDAKFTLDNVDYVKSTNIISDVLPQLSITLTKAGTPSAPVSTTFTVAQETKPLEDAAKAWVDSLNAALSLLKTDTDYNSDTRQAGILNGDGLARNLQTALRGMLSNVVSGLPSNLNQLSQVGITTGAWGTEDYGKVLLDTSKLASQLQADPDGVARVFGALRNNVALASQGAFTDTPSATSGGVFSAADVLNGDTASSRFGTAGGGWQSQGVPDPTQSSTFQNLDIYFDATKTVKKTFDEVQIFIPDTTAYPAASQGLKDFTLQYYGGDSQWHDITAVAGSTGTIKTIDFDPVTASGLRLLVTSTYGGAPARVTELRVNEVNNGGPAAMYTYLNSTLSISTGPIDTRTDNLTKQMDDMDTQIQRMTDQMNQHEQALRDQFARMEAALAKMQSQGNMLMGQLAGSAQSK